MELALVGVVEEVADVAEVLPELNAALHTLVCYLQRLSQRSITRKEVRAEENKGDFKERPSHNDKRVARSRICCT